MSDQPTYIKHLLTLPVRSGQVTTVVVRHDDDCPRLRGGQCRCDAVIEQMSRAERRSQRKRENR